MLRIMMTLYKLMMISFLFHWFRLKNYNTSERFLSTVTVHNHQWIFQYIFSPSETSIHRSKRYIINISNLIHIYIFKIKSYQSNLNILISSKPRLIFRTTFKPISKYQTSLNETISNSGRIIKSTHKGPNYKSNI